jgi:IS1 family transposase
MNAYAYLIGNTLGDLWTMPNSSRSTTRTLPKNRIATADLICTSHIERQNGSLRQWCRRLKRLTYAFSKNGTT